MDVYNYTQPVSGVSKGFRMCSLFLLCFALTSIFFTSGCIRSVSDDGRIPDTTSKSQNQKVISLPIDAIHMTRFGSNVLVQGYGEFVIVDLRTLEAKEVVLPRAFSEFITTDGGVTFLSHRSVVASKNGVTGSNQVELCSSDSAVVVAETVFSYGPCEHTGQMSVFGIGKENQKSYIINFTYSTFPWSDADDVVFAPRSIEKMGNQVFLPSNLKSGPAILEVNENAPDLRVVWQGKKKDGLLISASFLDSNAWIVTARGMLMRSGNSPSTMKYIADIPEKAVDKNPQVRFKNVSDGFLFCDEGLVFETSDGGKSWIEQKLGSNVSIIRTSVTGEGAIAITADGDLFLHSRTGDPWLKKYGFSGKIDDAIALEDSLLILSENKLYVLGD